MLKYIGTLMLSMLVLLSCNNEDQMARIEVRLTDSPGDYSEVNVDIQEIKVHSSEAGWVSLNTEKGVYNVLELTNGLDTLIGAFDLPPGRITQIRLILGDDNTIKIGDEVKPLITPSAQQSGLKLNVQADLIEGITYTVVLDFDAARSIVETGNDQYLLKPVIRALSEATSGAIAGAVMPLESQPAVLAIMGSDTVATAYTNDIGEFLIRGVPAGTYSIHVIPQTGFDAFHKDDVQVTIGNVTALGTIALQ